MFKVRVTGFTNVSHQFQSTSKELKPIVQQELESMAKDWVKQAKRDAPADEGTLIRGITYYKEGQRVEIVSSAFYSPFMEFGTKGKYRPIPGTEQIAAQFKGYKGGDIMQMLRMIVRWVRRKGIAGTYSVKTKKRTGNKFNQVVEDYSAAWPIVMSILRNGVRPHPFFFAPQDRVWPVFVKNVKKRIEQKSKVAVIMPGEVARPTIITI